MADRYHAFISYSHADEKWAAWLQRAIERYRIPKRLRAAHPNKGVRALFLAKNVSAETLIPDI